MTNFLILGAGRQAGACAAFILEQFADTGVIFVDNCEANLQTATELQKEKRRVSSLVLDVSRDTDELSGLMSDAACVISCVPYFLNADLAALAIKAGTSFCDMGGNVGTVQKQLAMADACKEAGVAIIPDCGVAPGLLSLMAEYWQDDWAYESVKLYCGGLPQNPTGMLNYSMTFSVHGLLNEYLDDCEVSRNGKLEIIPGMSELETISDLALPGTFEAFSTSGGASLGPQVYAPLGVDYQYKTIRYPGHRDMICAMWDVGFFDTAEREFTLGDQKINAAPRDIAAQIMPEHLKSDGKDLMVFRIDVTGKKDGKEVRGRVDLIDYAVDRFTAMERTTGFSTAIAAAALAGMYDEKIAPGAYVPFQVMNPKLTMEELARAGVVGMTVREL